MKTNVAAITISEREILGWAEKLNPEIDEDTTILRVPYGTLTVRVPVFPTLAFNTLQIYDTDRLYETVRLSGRPNHTISTLMGIYNVEAVYNRKTDTFLYSIHPW